MKNWLTDHKNTLAVGSSKAERRTEYNQEGVETRCVCVCVCVCTEKKKRMFLCAHRSVVSESFATPWTLVHQAPLSMEFPRQEY